MEIQELYKKMNAPILVKGGHLSGKYVIDTLFDGRNILRFKNKKIGVKYTHGTGCSLASAISFFLGGKKETSYAVESSIKFVRKVLLNSKKNKFNGYLSHQV